MCVSNIPRVKSLLTNIDPEEVKMLSKRILKLNDPAQSQAELLDYIDNKLNFTP